MGMKVLGTGVMGIFLGVALLGARPAQADAACPLEFKKLKQCASIEWISQPSTEREGAFTIRFWSKASGKPAPRYEDPKGTLVARLFMPTMGHGSSPTRIVPHETGVFDVQKLRFMMPGHWDLHIELKKASVVLDEVVLGFDL